MSRAVLVCFLIAAFLVPLLVMVTAFAELMNTLTKLRTTLGCRIMCDTAENAVRFLADTLTALTLLLTLAYTATLLVLLIRSRDREKLRN